MPHVVPPNDATKPPWLSGQEANVLKYVEDGTGREIELVPFKAKRFDVEPLDFKQLVGAAGAKQPSFPLKISNASAAKSLTGLEKDGPLSVTATMHTGPVLAYGLVDGGWLPMPWAHKPMAMLDRNLVIQLEKLQAGETHESRQRLTEWLGLDSETVSPMLFALEGANRRPPTEAEVRDQLARAQKVLGKLLPGSKMQDIGPVNMRALHRIVVDHTEFREKASRFLVQAAPMVAEPVKPLRRPALEADLTRMAAAEGVRRGCLAFLALLSCLYDSAPHSPHRTARPGRAVLKPSKRYTENDAYNALTDLFFIETMANVQELFPDMHPVLYTADAGLAAFWAALQPWERQLTHLPEGRSRTTVTFNMSGGLFPDLDLDEVEQLATRIGGEL